MSIEANTRIKSSAENSFNLKEAYDHWFDVIPANTPGLVERANRLRYQVYCVENNYEDPSAHPCSIERDEYDKRSVHSLLATRTSGAIAGTVRLILPASKPEESFPIQGICKSPRLSDPKMFYHGKAAEISRFCISKEFRQTLLHEGSDCETTPWSDSGKQDLIPYITLGLMKGIVQMSAEHGVTDLFAVMEPSLLRLLTRFGIFFKPIGPIVQYHGMRQPCYENVEKLLGKIWNIRKDVWDVITEEGTLLDQLRSKHNAAASCKFTQMKRCAVPMHAC